MGLHAQTTYIWQAKPAFNAAYSGPNSLSPLREKSYSFTVTGDLGLRLWDGAQVHLNPEGAQGVPLSNLLGAGGISNGELARGSSSTMVTYRARLFVQQRFNVGGDAETVDADFNELGGKFTPGAGPLPSATSACWITLTTTPTPRIRASNSPIGRS